MVVLCDTKEYRILRKKTINRENIAINEVISKRLDHHFLAEQSHPSSIRLSKTKKGGLGEESSNVEVYSNFIRDSSKSGSNMGDKVDITQRITPEST
tara:strand:- start:48 stop:338 length:291 start_codon:yes stop_codon:yes gene_type:complete